MYLIFILLLLITFHLELCGGNLGILVHGYNIRAKGWDKVVFGDLKSLRMGRSTHALLLVSQLLKSHKDSVNCIVWGSGVNASNGLLEGEYTLQMVVNKSCDLVLFPEFRNFTNEDIDHFLKHVQKVSILDNCSTNTVTEIKNAFRIFKERGISTIILVSSSTHAPRCLRDACCVLNSDFKDWRPILMVSPSGTSFPDTIPDDVAIAEPPHLPDDTIPLNSLVRRLINIRRSKRSNLSLDLENLLQIYEK